MRVYSKKEDKQTMAPGIIVTIIFLSFSIGMFVAAITSGKSFMDILASFGSLLVFAIIFFGFGLYFVYALLKKPKAYKAKLIKKQIEIYNGKQITYMEFQTEQELREIMENEVEKNLPEFSDAYKCYTIGENDLIQGNDYSLKIKEFNWEPKFVEEINNIKSDTSTVPNANLSLVHLVIGLFWGVSLLLCLLGTIMYPQYNSTYVIVGAFFGFALFMTFYDYRKRR